MLCPDHHREVSVWLRTALAVAVLVTWSGETFAQIVSATTSGTGSLNWATAAWSPSAPGATSNGGDVAVFSGSGNVAVTLSSTITLGRLDDSQMTGNFTLTGGRIIFKSGSSAPATMLMTRNAAGLYSLQRQLFTEMQLDSDLVATFPKQQQRNVGFTNVISGVGGLSIYVNSRPSSGTDSNVEVLTSGTTAGTNGRITVRIGATGTANTHSGGTNLYGQSGLYTGISYAGNFNNIDFRVYATNALGSGALSLSSAALNLDVYDQTVAGLTGGSGSSKVSTLSGTAGTTTLTLDFDASAGTKTFSGQIMSGSTTGYFTLADSYGNLATDTMVRLLGLRKRGTGTQILTGMNTYTGATTISGGTLQIGDSGTTGSIADSSAVSIGSGATLAFSRSDGVIYGGTVSGAGSLVQRGAGKLTLAAASTYTGATTVASGTLAFGIDNAISGSSAITIGSGGARGTLELGAFDLTTTSLTFTGLGGVLPTGSGGEVFLSSTTGTATISAVSGSSAVHPTMRLTSDAVIDVNPAATFVLHADVQGAGRLTKIGTGTMTMHGASGYSGGTFLNQGRITVANANALVFGTGTVTLGDDTVLDLGGAAIDNVIVFASGTATSAVILNSGSFVSLSGPGSLSSGTAATISASYKLLSGASITFESPFSGSALVQSGGSGLFSGNVSGLVSVAAGGAARIDGDVTTDGDVVSSGSTAIYGTVYDNVAVNGGTTSIFGTTAVGSLVSTGTGGVAARTLLSGTVNGGAHVGNAGVAEFSNLVTGAITADAGGTVILKDGYSTTASTINLNGSLVIDRTSPLSLGPSIGGSGGLQVSSGLVTLLGNNTYTGSTAVSGGMLAISSGGAINSTSGVTVNGANAEFKYNSATTLSQPLTLTQGTLSGTGAIGTTVTVGSGATLSPGNSPGTQAFTSGLTWQAGGTYDWEINDATGALGGTPGWDLLDVTGGTLNLASLTPGSFTLDLITLSSLVSGSMANYTPGQAYTWQIVRTTAGGVLTSSGTAAGGTDLTSLFSIVTTNWASGPAPSTVQVKVSSGGTGLDLVVVPEPETLFLAGIGVFMAGWSLLKPRRIAAICGRSKRS